MRKLYIIHDICGFFRASNLLSGLELFCFALLGPLKLAAGKKKCLSRVQFSTVMLMRAAVPANGLIQGVDDAKMATDFKCSFIIAKCDRCMHSRALYSRIGINVVAFVFSLFLMRRRIKTVHIIYKTILSFWQNYNTQNMRYTMTSNFLHGTSLLLGTRETSTYSI